jgi:4-alpha-glucanotransferase
VARRFVDYLAGAGQTLWQVLPLGPTGFGDSPYQCFSALAGNSLLISLEDLSGTVPAAPAFFTDRVNFEQIIPWKMAALEATARQFTERSAERDRRRFEEFCNENAAWLDDFALFMALKGRDPSRVWTQWEEDIRARDPRVLEQWRARLAEPIATHKFLQYAFFSQWGALRSYCRECGVHIMGDLPIYVAHDSVDVWVNPQYFQLDESGNPTAVAGVPPDYFSATGQLWGNPLYAWDAIARDGYSWWWMWSGWIIFAGSRHTGKFLPGLPPRKAADG